MTHRILIYNTIFLLTIINFGCNTQNHIDNCEVSLDSLKTLPDGFYAFRHGRIYFEDAKLEKYRIWFNLDKSGNVENIFKVEDFKDNAAEEKATIGKYSIDTSDYKIIMQKFIDLSVKYKFGHINIDRTNKISFSNKDGLPEQYVKTYNDSANEIYLKNFDFKLLNNGWFEYVGK